MRQLKNIDIWPPNGWTYEQPNTGFVFSGSSLQEIISKTRLHRESNGLAIGGNLALEIQDQIVRRSPKWFTEWEEVPPLRGLEEPSGGVTVEVKTGGAER